MNPIAVPWWNECTSRNASRVDLSYGLAGSSIEIQGAPFNPKARAGAATSAHVSAARARLRIRMRMATSSARLRLRCCSVREGLRRRSDPVHTAAGAQHVQLAGRVLAQRRHVAEAHVEGPTGPPGDGTIRVGKTAQPPRTVVRVKVLPGQGWPAAAAVDEPPDD